MEDVNVLLPMTTEGLSMSYRAPVGTDVCLCVRVFVRACVRACEGQFI